MSLNIGEYIRHYRIVEQIGQGGMATVYKAHDANLDRYVAIKVMRHAEAGDADFLVRFRREARIVARLRHPHIVAIHEFADHDGQPYLVMEYIAGESMHARLRRQRYSLAETIAAMEAVASALTYAHEQGVLHRDIKPSNILLDEAGVPYLTDFGLARLMAEGESPLSQSLMLGTPFYISPEQARGVTELTPATDIYSLGVVLFRLLTGRVPFQAETPLAIAHAHVYTPLPLPSEFNPNIPPAVETVLLRALAKEPADRHPSAVALIEDFSAAVEAFQSGPSGVIRPVAPQTGRAPQTLVPLAPQTLDRPAVNATQASGGESTGATPVVPVQEIISASIELALQRQQQKSRSALVWGGVAVFTVLVVVAVLLVAIFVSNNDNNPAVLNGPPPTQIPGQLRPTLGPGTFPPPTRPPGAPRPTVPPGAIPPGMPGGPAPGQFAPPAQDD